jgi:hypothetical protein
MSIQWTRWICIGNRRDDIIYLDKYLNDFFKVAGIPKQYSVPIEVGEKSLLWPRTTKSNH